MSRPTFRQVLECAAPVALFVRRGRVLICVLASFCSQSGAADAVSSTEKGFVKQVGPGLFEIGKVHLNKTERKITIPCSINMSEGTVEYFLVTATGKTHESILRTDAEPYHIHLAMLLLGAKGKGTNEFPHSTAQKPPGDPIKLEVTWKSTDKPMRMRAEELVWDRATKASMQKLEWIYNGSQIDAEGFAAQRTGSIVSLIDDPEALINNPLPLRSDDENWKAYEGRVPTNGAPVEVMIILVNK